MKEHNLFHEHWNKKLFIDETNASVYDNNGRHISHCYSKPEFFIFDWNGEYANETFVKIGDQYFHQHLLHPCSNGKLAISFILRENIGFFAQLTNCVLISKACAEKGIEPYFFLSNCITLQKGLIKNPLEYYFKPKNIPNRDRNLLYKKCINNKAISFFNRAQINFFSRGGVDNEIMNEITSLEEGKKLFDVNFSFKGYITDIVNKFCHSNFGAKTLGVHFRGKDKIGSEALEIDSAEIFKHISQQINGGYEKIFIATDDSYFLKKCYEAFGDRIIVFRKDINALYHFQDVEKNFKKNATALIDCIILSRCNLLIKTPSALSAWSLVFNPIQNVICLGKPFKNPWNEVNLEGFGYWPEKCLH